MGAYPTWVTPFGYSAADSLTMRAVGHRLLKDKKRKMQKRVLLKFAAAASVLSATGLMAACGDKKAAAPAAAASTVTLKVGATPVPHAEILNFIAPTLKKEGIDLKVVEFTDYVQPNVALNDKELDANFFQHVPYLNSFMKDRKMKLAVLCKVHTEPMGVYSDKVKDLKDLKEKGKIGIPNDPTNGGRALRVLADAGVLQLKDGVGVNGTKADITGNPKNFEIVEMEAALLPRSYKDLDAAVINSNFAMGAGLNPTKDALFLESKDSPYANVVAIREGDDRPELKKLAAALQSPEVKKFIEEKYKGAVIAAF